MNKVITVGTSRAVIIPKKEADFFEWNIGELVLVDITKDRIIIKRLSK